MSASDPAVPAPGADSVYETRLRRELRRGNTWTETDFGGHRIYWCWWAGYGAMGGRYVKRVLIGRAG